MYSYKYDTVVLNNIESLLQVNQGLRFIEVQDNASCHRSKETQANPR